MEFLDGQWDGRTVREWLPEVLSDVVEAARPLQVMATIRRAIRAPVPVNVLVTDPDQIAERGSINGSSLYWPLREGRVMLLNDPHCGGGFAWGPVGAGGAG